MIDQTALADCLRSIGLPKWHESLSAIIDERMSPKGHGDYSRWQDVVDAVEGAAGDHVALKSLLLALSPWRKGPFDIAGVHIDTEWRSDLKWSRVEDAIAPLSGRNVLDVGCGNGYYGLQMRAAGANTVIGVDPTILFVMQFLALNTFLCQQNLFVLPIRLHELPLPARVFDTTFSMGVLYHQRSPIDHLRQLRQTLRPDGQLVLETIYVPGAESYACTPADRYARMRNVWLLPTVAELCTWLRRVGFEDVDVVDKSVTTTDEQRATEWMTSESLREALDPDDSSRTIEGWPAPHRIVITAISP